jgi:hypothetical protein
VCVTGTGIIFVIVLVTRSVYILRQGRFITTIRSIIENNSNLYFEDLSSHDSSSGQDGAQDKTEVNQTLQLLRSPIAFMFGYFVLSSLMVIRASVIYWNRHDILRRFQLWQRCVFTNYYDTTSTSSWQDICGNKPWRPISHIFDVVFAMCICGHTIVYFVIFHRMRIHRTVKHGIHRLLRLMARVVSFFGCAWMCGCLHRYLAEHKNPNTQAVVPVSDLGDDGGINNNNNNNNNNDKRSSTLHNNGGIGGDGDADLEAGGVHVRNRRNSGCSLASNAKSSVCGDGMDGGTNNDFDDGFSLNMQSHHPNLNNSKFEFTEADLQEGMIEGDEGFGMATANPTVTVRTQPPSSQSHSHSQSQSQSQHSKDTHNNNQYAVAGSADEQSSPTNPTRAELTARSGDSSSGNNRVNNANNHATVPSEHSNHDSKSSGSHNKVVGGAAGQNQEQTMALDDCPINAGTNLHTIPEQQYVSMSMANANMNANGNGQQSRGGSAKQSGNADNNSNAAAQSSGKPGVASTFQSFYNSFVGKNKDSSSKAGNEDILNMTIEVKKQRMMKRTPSYSNKSNSRVSSSGVGISSITMSDGEYLGYNIVDDDPDDPNNNANNYEYTTEEYYNFNNSGGNASNKNSGSQRLAVGDAYNEQNSSSRRSKNFDISNDNTASNNNSYSNRNSSHRQSTALTSAGTSLMASSTGYTTNMTTGTLGAVSTVSSLSPSAAVAVPVSASSSAYASVNLYTSSAAVNLSPSVVDSGGLQITSRQMQPGVGGGSIASAAQDADNNRPLRQLASDSNKGSAKLFRGPSSGVGNVTGTTGNASVSISQNNNSISGGTTSHGGGAFSTAGQSAFGSFTKPKIIKN